VLRLPELRAVADILPVDFVAETEGEAPVTELVIAYQNSTFMDWLRFPSVDKSARFLQPDHFGIASGLLAVHRVRTLDVDGDGDLDLAAAGQDVRDDKNLTKGPGSIALVINNLTEAATAAERWQQHEIMQANGAALVSDGDAWLLEPLSLPGAAGRVALVAALEVTAGDSPMAHRLVSLERDIAMAVDDWAEVVIAEFEPAVLRLAVGDADADQRQELAFIGRNGVALRSFQATVDGWNGEHVGWVSSYIKGEVAEWKAVALGYGQLDESDSAPGWEIAVGGVYFQRDEDRWSAFGIESVDEVEAELSLIDLNADDHLDLVSVQGSKWHLHYSVDTGSGVYRISDLIAWDEGTVPKTVAYTDSIQKPELFAPRFFSLPGDGDALPELFFLDEEAGRLLRSPPGTTDFSAVTDFDVVANMNTNGLRELAVGDIIPETAGEAVDELVMVGPNSDWINIFRYDGEQWGKVLWEPRLGNRSDPVGKLSLVSVNDIDANGTDDIVVAERDGGNESGDGIRPLQRIIRFFYDADGERRSEVLRSVRGQPSDIVLDDIDGDGLLDIVVSTNDNGRVYLLRNNSADLSDG